MTTQYVCISVPYFIGRRLDSTSELDAIRDHVSHQISAEWVEVKPEWQAKEPTVITVNRAIAKTIARHADCTPLVFAPDCVSALGILKGLENQQPDILWLDAHGDFNTPQTTRSGFLGGMPLAALVGRGNDDMLRGLHLSPIREDKVTLADARNLDPEESDLLRSSQVKHLRNVADVLKETWSGQPLYIHLDADVLDPSDMPTLHYPEPNGPSLEALVEVIKHTVKSSALAGAYISLWDDARPGADTARQTTFLLIDALVS